MEQAQSETPYSNGSETPLEIAARADAETEGHGGQARREEHEANVLVGDIDQYVAETDPGSLPEAERQLDAWQIPTNPLEGVPDNVALEPESEPLVAVFAAQSEAEANIVRGLLEASGIPAFVNALSGPALGGIFQPDETRWGEILVSSSEADAARAAIAEATATDHSEDQ